MKYVVGVFAFILVLLLTFQLTSSGMGSQEAIDGYIETQSRQSSKIPLPTKDEVQDTIEESIEIAKTVAQQSNGKLTLRLPVNYGSIGMKITSIVNSREAGIHPTGHNGVDFARNGGEPPIVAATDGVVKYVNYTGDGGGYGSYIVITEQGTGLEFTYAHMQPGSVVKRAVGSKVKAGDQLGIMGTSGHSTGVHLHFGIERPKSSTFRLGTALYKGRFFDPLDPDVFEYIKETVPSNYLWQAPGPRQQVPLTK